MAPYMHGTRARLVHKQLLPATVAVTVPCTNNKMYAPYYYRYILISLPLPSHFVFICMFSPLCTAKLVGSDSFPRRTYLGWNEISAHSRTESANRKILSAINALGFALFLTSIKHIFPSAYYILLSFNLSWFLFHTNHRASLGNTYPHLLLIHFSSMLSLIGSSTRRT